MIYHRWLALIVSIIIIVILPVNGWAFSIRGILPPRRSVAIARKSHEAPPHVANQQPSSAAENDAPRRRTPPPPPSPPIVDDETPPTIRGRMPICTYRTISVIPNDVASCPDNVPRQAVSVEDLTPRLRTILADSRMSDGVLHVLSMHTTTAIAINEYEARLARDVANYFLDICPPDERSSSERRRAGVRYLHNDVHERPEGREEAERCRDNGWDVDDTTVLERWRDQEPINAHSHLISMMIGSSECIPVVDGEMVIGEWQSVLMIDLDGPRNRTVGVQLMGYE
ncbi:hypothetical protein ACHAXA_009819 [Cyclostephanos tholiformis]|uniref:Secondary thiamine-phosphate synthase enzyme n=1 Tax=Cyclostephanos tholiformis TaxID=382380 RepID=A0ABD3R670_9STRA